MEVGQLGVHGILVVKVVEKVSKNAGEAAQNRRLEMVVNLALVHPNKIERVTRTIVQVKSLLTLCLLRQKILKNLLP